jgi:hypothetical protein
MESLIAADAGSLPDPSLVLTEEASFFVNFRQTDTHASGDCMGNNGDR